MMRSRRFSFSQTEPNQTDQGDDREQDRGDDHDGLQDCQREVQFRQRLGEFGKT